jgi:AraC-like DNA-binding protein
MKTAVQITDKGRESRRHANVGGDLFVFQAVKPPNSVKHSIYTSTHTGHFGFSRESASGFLDNKNYHGGVGESLDVSFMRRAISIIEQDFADFEFTTKTLSRKLAVSQRQFFRKFKTLFGCTPNVLIRHVRLEYAAQLLKESQMTISEIIYSVGFCDPKYFRAAFRKRFGVLPSEYCRHSHKIGSREHFANSKTML